MCNFVPGDVIAVGPIGALRELPSTLPGQLSKPKPLISETGELADSPLVGVGSVVLKTEPGAELFAMTHLAAALAPQIKAQQALVDLNHLLPVSAEPMDPEELRLTPRAEEVIADLRACLRQAVSAFARRAGPRPTLRVAVLDSGIDARLTLHRAHQFLDYSKNGQLSPESPPSDSSGHGTKVIKILNEILPPEVELVVGKLSMVSTDLTTLVVAHALGDLIARTSPDVVNLSFSTVDQVVVCKKCRERVAVAPFFSSMLPMVVRLAGKSQARTVAVMAAGNEGKVANCRWIHSDLDNLVLALAENRRGHRTKYSAVVEGPLADLYSASVFGGDDPADADAMGVFSDGTHGTSFAAPFVTAAALIAKQLPKMMAPEASTDLGLRVQAIIRGNVSFSQGLAPERAKAG